MDQENRMPLIGDKAPSFEAVTTQGPIKFPEDYAGKWVILFSHPADLHHGVYDLWLYDRRVQGAQY